MQRRPLAIPLTSQRRAKLRRVADNPPYLEAPSQDSLPGRIIDTHPPKNRISCLPSSPAAKRTFNNLRYRSLATPQLPSRSRKLTFSALPHATRKDRTMTG
jgi:hypothetical protein